MSRSLVHLLRVACTRLAFCSLVIHAACAPERPALPDVEPVATARFPTPLVPDDNPITDEKAALGRALFFDVRLSGNGTQACGSCHEPARAFADGKALPQGSTGDTIPRNAMGLANVAFFATYTWMNPVLTTLEAQALVPMFAEHPVELGMTTNENTILQRLQNDAALVSAFAAAFPNDDAPITMDNIVLAIATFERTLISSQSPYDAYSYLGNADALSDEEKLGMQLFNSEVTECYHCHGGPTFAESFVAEGIPPTRGFHNTGVYNVDDNGSYPEPNTGLFAFTGDNDDMGKMRAPSLRNLSYTAPYFHDGSAATLEDVLDHYQRGGRTVTGTHAGVGANNPHKDPLVRAFELTERERAALLAFLRALDDEAFVTNPAFSNPFATTPNTP